jgi:hypothetical protein
VYKIKDEKPNSKATTTTPTTSLLPRSNTTRIQSITENQDVRNKTNEIKLGAHGPDPMECSNAQAPTYLGRSQKKFNPVSTLNPNF